MNMDRTLSAERSPSIPVSLQATCNACITSRPLNPVYSLAPDPEGRVSDQLCTTGYYYSASRCTLNTTRLVVLYLSHAVP